MFLVLPFRCYSYQKVIRELGKDYSPDKTRYRLPWREFKADMVTWLIIGAIMSALYLIYFKSPVSTGIKILIGCISFGLFGGMLSFLAMENRIFNRLRTVKMEETFSPEKMLPVSRKILFFMVTVLLFMVIVILLMVFVDINYLLTNKDLFGPDIYMGVFKEILFAL